MRHIVSKASPLVKRSLNQEPRPIYDSTWDANQRVIIGKNWLSFSFENGRAFMMLELTINVSTSRLNHGPKFLPSCMDQVRDSANVSLLISVRMASDTAIKN